MTRPSKEPTIADLYLAFRQAKTALYFDRRGVGLQLLAEYEQKLPANLQSLKAKVANGKWFDQIEIGETWIVPKRLHEADGDDDGVVRIGVPRKAATGRHLDIQLRLSPHPDFAVVEVLYLWRFGGLLEALLSKKEVVGYRLDLREQRVVPHRRWLFEYWPKQYQAFRSAPLKAAKAALEAGKRTMIMCADLASFYDTVDPSFMLGKRLFTELEEHGASEEDISEYRRATVSLLKAYARFHKIASSRAALPIEIGVPIGALTSRVVANLSLATLDRHIAAQSGILCYRRYVDDIVIVAHSPETDEDLAATMRRFLPILPGDDTMLKLDAAALDREGSEFQLQKAKVRVHHLAGAPGSDFVKAVAFDFAKTVSGRRAFVDSSTLVGDGISHLISVGKAAGSPLRVLREADRARLERFALSTSLSSLERVSSLIGRDEARNLIRDSLERIGRVLDAEDNWVADLEVSFRLLKLAISTGDWESAQELLGRMDRVWGTDESLRALTPCLHYRSREIKPDKKSPWVWLRNYLHERRVEAMSSVFPIGVNTGQIAAKFPGGLKVRTKLVKVTELRERAEQLAVSDLRARDREDDALLNSRDADSGRDWLRSCLEEDEELSARLSLIDKFIQRCRELDDRPWLMPAARLFLCTRPPSYFDIARRWLYSVEREGFSPEVFEQLLDIVNAVRGTQYREAVGKVVDRSTVSVEPLRETESPSVPRIILGNLSVGGKAWKAAAIRTHCAPYNAPMLTLERLRRVANILDQAAHVVHDHVSAVLVLPELSLPRQWFRPVSNHVVRFGRFGMIAGIEYKHHPKHAYVSNQVFAVLPGPFASAATWPWTKRLPAHEESQELAKLNPPVSFPPPPLSGLPRIVVKSEWGSLSVLLFSELIEARRAANLPGRVNVVL